MPQGHTIGRYPTAVELKKWREFERAFDRCTLVYIRARVLQNQADLAYRVAQKHNVTLPYDPTLTDRLDQIGQWIELAKQIVHKVDLQHAGIVLTNGDIDIVEPKTDLGDMSGIIIPIIMATGAVLLVGAIAQALKKHMEAKEAAEKLETVTQWADDKFCDQTGSAMCNDWQNVKQSVEYQRNESFIDTIGDRLSEVGKQVTKGVSFGLLIAIPLLAWAWLAPRRS